MPSELPGEVRAPRGRQQDSRYLGSGDAHPQSLIRVLRKKVILKCYRELHIQLAYTTECWKNVPNDVQSRAIQVLIKSFIEENTDTDKNY